ncbi:hypothetical protein GOV11_02290 [Candidatus Woesearchaeota archaeon]|nr:hypothetical protein [Candidatus Woesearchaeota archaeon]
MGKQLMYVLSAVIVLNVIFILLMQVKLDESAAPVVPRPVPKVIPPPEPEVLPEVRTLVLESSDCPECYDVRAYADLLKNQINILLEDGPDGIFETKILPALVFNQSIEEYPEMLTDWELWGSIKTIDEGLYAGKWYVLPTFNPPFWDVKEQRMRGDVVITLLDMKECKECYDVDIHRQNIENQYLSIKEEHKVDISSPEGKELLEKYGITAVPTIIIGPEAEVYPGFEERWSVVGTKEDDGSFILRDMQRIQLTYYDLLQERVMEP